MTLFSFTPVISCISWYFPYNYISIRFLWTFSAEKFLSFNIFDFLLQESRQILEFEFAEEVYVLDFRFPQRLGFHGVCSSIHHCQCGVYPSSNHWLSFPFCLMMYDENIYDLIAISFFWKLLGRSYWSCNWTDDADSGLLSGSFIDDNVSRVHKPMQSNARVGRIVVLEYGIHIISQWLQI